jgi:hypothetical protein
MLTLCATALLGLLAQQPGAAAPERAANQTVPAPVPLTEVPNGTACVFFDEVAMRGRLLSSDLAAREQAFNELVVLARRSTSIRTTVDAWGRESTSLDLAWTSRLVMRELRKEMEGAISGQPQPVMRQSTHGHRPWVTDYEKQMLVAQRQLLINLGVDPDEYRISGLMRMTPTEAERLGLIGSQPTDPPQPVAVQPAPVEDVLGVACDESRDDRVILTRVLAGSIADSIGLKAGDHLLSVAGLELNGPADINEAMHIWRSRGADASDVLEVLAISGSTGEPKVLVWIPPSSR